MKQINRSSLKIIIEAALMVLSLLFGILFGNYLNEHQIFNDEHMTNWTLVLVVMCAVVVYVIIWAVVSIKKQNKNSNQ